VLTRVALALALAIPAVPAHAATEEYQVTPSCALRAVDNSAERTTYVVVGTATARSTVSAPLSTTIRCFLLQNGGQWSDERTTPGAFSALAGATIWSHGLQVCAQGAATFSDGMSVETSPCT
jgi:hypothetical protein